MGARLIERLRGRPIAGSPELASIVRANSHRRPRPNRIHPSGRRLAVARHPSSLSYPGRCGEATCTSTTGSGTPASVALAFPSNDGSSNGDVGQRDVEVGKPGGFDVRAGSDQLADRLGHLPYVDVHRGHEAPVAQPERDELTGSGGWSDGRDGDPASQVDTVVAVQLGEHLRYLGSEDVQQRQLGVLEHGDFGAGGAGGGRGFQTVAAA